MHDNFVYPSVTEALPGLLRALENRGNSVESRAGDTKELTHVGITLFNPLDREILCDFRKPNIAAQIAETMWVLAGRDDISWLEHYLPRVRDFSDDGETWRAGYGARLRRWEDHAHARTIDQWRWLIAELKKDPTTRRGVMSIWDPTIDTDPGKDIPCNDWLSFLSRNGRLDLHVAIRSNDVIWGWSGINQFEWSALLEITAGMAALEAGSLHFSTTSFHLYEHHFAKAERIRNQRLEDTSLLNSSPRFDASVVNYNFDLLEVLFEQWFQIEYDIRTGSPLVQGYVDNFPEPMLRSWLRILQWWWGEGRDAYLLPLRNTRLDAATRCAMQPKRKVTETISFFSEESPEPLATVEVPSTLFLTKPLQTPFIEYVIKTHNEKHAAYGDSWKRRGEMLGILANIARKVDRLGGAETSDETSADTAMDLFVYLAKYLVWLHERVQGPIFRNWGGSDTTSAANEVMRDVDLGQWNSTALGAALQNSNEALQEELRVSFDELEKLASAGESRIPLVNEMLAKAYVLAMRLYTDLEADQYRGADAADAPERNYFWDDKGKQHQSRG